MNKCLLSLILLVVCCCGVRAENAYQWQDSDSRHFLVYFNNAPADFINRLINKAEDYYDIIADNLGFRRYNFWLRAERAKIYIYDNAQDFRSATFQPSWSSGCADAARKIIYTFPYAQGFFDTVLPHEMGHIIFREFVGFSNSAVPLWLDEGVASYQESIRRSTANQLVKEAINQNRFVSLEGLSSMGAQSSWDAKTANLFYAEAISVVDYLINKFGKDNFVLFCQALRDTKDLNRALSRVYPFIGVEELNQQWQKYVK